MLDVLLQSHDLQFLLHRACFGLDIAQNYSQVLVHSKGVDTFSPLHSKGAIVPVPD